MHKLQKDRKRDNQCKKSKNMNTISQKMQKMQKRQKRQKKLKRQKRRMRRMRWKRRKIRPLKMKKQLCSSNSWQMTNLRINLTRQRKKKASLMHSLCNR